MEEKETKTKIPINKQSHYRRHTQQEGNKVSQIESNSTDWLGKVTLRKGYLNVSSRKKRNQ